MDKTFDEAIAGIRKAERGVEVREDIAQGMEYVKQYAEEVTDQQQAALQAAADRGVAIVPTTGRPLGNLPPVVAPLPSIRYALTSNGAAVWDLGDAPLAAVYSRYSNAAQRRT